MTYQRKPYYDLQHSTADKDCCLLKDGVDLFDPLRLEGNDRWRLMNKKMKAVKSVSKIIDKLRKG